MDEEDVHMCLVCQTTISGLLNYINHKKNECSGRKNTKSEPEIRLQQSTFSSVDNVPVTDLQGTSNALNSFSLIGASTLGGVSSPTYTNSNQQSFPLGSSLQNQGPAFGDSVLNTQASTGIGNAYDTVFEGAGVFSSASTENINQLTDINSLYLKQYGAITTCSQNTVSCQNLTLFDSQNSVISSPQANSDITAALALSPSIFTSTQTTLNLCKSVESPTIDEDHGILNACIGNITNQTQYIGDGVDFTQPVNVQIQESFSMINSEKSPNENNSVNINDIMASNHDKEEESRKTASEKVDDFFQSLELMSKTAPRIEKGVSFSQPLLPISNILGNLTFSSDEEDLGFNFADDVSLDSFSDSEMAPPRHHTGGKWKPGENPDVVKRQRQTFRGKWPPGEAPVQMSVKYYGNRSRGGKNIRAFTHPLHKERKRKPRSKARIKKEDNSKTFSCTFCDVTFSCRFKYSNHCGSLLHKENVFGKRDDLQSDFKRGRGKSFKMIPAMDGNQETIEESHDLSPDIQPVESLDNENKNVNVALADNNNICKYSNENSEYPDCSVTGNNEIFNNALHKDAVNDEKPDNAHNSMALGFESLKQPHICTVCDKKYGNKYLMSRHLLTKYHRNRSAVNQSEAFKLLETYHKYIVRLSPYQCEICRFYFNTNQDFENHLKNIQHLKNCSDLIGEMTCTLCKFKTHSMSILAKHFECGEHTTNIAKCDKICILKESHVKCRCKFCGLVMYSFTRLKHHVMIKHVDRKIVNCIVKKENGKRNQPFCTECTKQFQSQSALDLHFRRKHSKVKPYICHTCNVSFAGKHAMKIHLNTSRHMQIADRVKNMKKEDINENNLQTNQETVVSKNGKAKGRERKLPKRFKVETNPDGSLSMKNEQTTLEVDKEDEINADVDAETTDAYNEITDNETESAAGASDVVVGNSNIVDAKSLRDENSDKEWIPEKKLSGKRKLVGVAVKLKKAKTSNVQRTVKATKEKTFKCNHCPFTVKTYNDLRPHYLKEHSSQIKICEICDLVFLSEKALKLHIYSKDHQENIEKSGETSIKQFFQCHICKKRFADEKYCKFHTAYSHFHITSEEAVLSEYKGHDVTRQKYDHVLKEIESLEPHANVQCPDCSMFFKKNHFIEHLRVHTNDRPFKCKICPKEFASGVTLRRHLLGHFGCAERTCEICGKFFKKTGSFRDHMKLCSAKKSDAEKVHTCETCGQSFYMEYQLQTHMKRHGKREFACTVPGCPWKFIYRNELKFHMHSHTGHKPFLCDICGYSAVTKCRLKRHHRTHTGERNYHCEYCTYKAGNSTHLHRHMRIHIGSKPFKCPHCDYACNTHENMRKHIVLTKKHDGLKIYPCKFCDYGTNSSKEFRSHLVYSHEAELGPEFRATALSMFTGLYHKELDPKRPEAGTKIIQVRERVGKAEPEKKRKHATKCNDEDRKSIETNLSDSKNLKKEVNSGFIERNKDTIEIKPLEMLPNERQAPAKDSNKVRNNLKQNSATYSKFSDKILIRNDDKAQSDGFMSAIASQLLTKNDYVNDLTPVLRTLAVPQTMIMPDTNPPTMYMSFSHSDLKPNTSHATSTPNSHDHPGHKTPNMGGAVPDTFPRNQSHGNGYSNFTKANRETVSVYHDYCMKTGISSQNGDDTDTPGNLIIDMGYSTNQC